MDKDGPADRRIRLASSAFWLMVTVVGIFAGCLVAGAHANGFGYVEGRVALTPMCPVKKESMPCNVPPEAYRAREILLSSGREIVARIHPDGRGTFRIKVAAGSYVANINRVGADSSSDVPREIQVSPGETMRLDITIDTGIR